MRLAQTLAITNDENRFGSIRWSGHQRITTEGKPLNSIIFKRESAIFQDKFRVYRILIDGQEVGSIGERQQVVIQMTPGRKNVQMKIDWCTSPQIEVNIPEEGDAVVRCGPNANPLLALLYISFLRKRYIWARTG